MTAVALRVQAAHAFLDGKSAKGLSRPQLVALTSTPRRGAARAEERPQVVAARLVGGHDRDRTVPRGHARNHRGQRVQWSWRGRARAFGHARASTCLPVDAMVGGHTRLVEAGESGTRREPKMQLGRLL